MAVLSFVVEQLYEESAEPGGCHHSTRHPAFLDFALSDLLAAHDEKVNLPRRGWRLRALDSRRNMEASSEYAPAHDDLILGIWQNS